MTQGWLISLVLANFPALATLVLIIYVFLRETSKQGTLRSILEGILGISIVIVFSLFLLPIVSIICTVVLFPAIFSVVNLLFILVDDGFSGLVNDLTSGVLGLRVCSIISVWTSIQFISMEFYPEREQYTVYDEYSKSEEAQHGYGIRKSLAHQDYINHPATLYAGSAKSAGHFGNLFFFSTILTLWIQFILGFESIFFPVISFLLFFIIDDWALLIHFKMYAEKAVTKIHRIRLYLAFVSIMLLTFLSAFDVNETILFVAALIVCMFGSLSIGNMKLEERYLKELKKMGSN